MKIVAVLAVALALAGCGGAQDPQPAAPGTAAPTAAAPTPTDAAGGVGTPVRIEDFSFTPDVVTIAATDTVTWDYSTNGAAQHTVDFDDGEQSEVLRPGDTYERTFAEPGEFAYVCRFHPNMTGVVTVQ